MTREQFESTRFYKGQKACLRNGDIVKILEVDYSQDLLKISCKDGWVTFVKFYAIDLYIPKQL